MKLYVVSLQCYTTWLMVMVPAFEHFSVEEEKKKGGKDRLPGS